MLARRVTVCTEWLYSGMACGYWSAPPSLLSGRRCTCGWSHLHDIDLWQELDLLLSFIMLAFFVCVCFGNGWVWGNVAFSEQVSISSFPAPLHAQLIALSHMQLHLAHSLWLMLFPTPGLFSSCPCKLYPSFKILLHKAVPAPSAGRNPFLTLHLLPLSHLVSLPP